MLIDQDHAFGRGNFHQDGIKDRIHDPIFFETFGPVAEIGNRRQEDDRASTVRPAEALELPDDHHEIVPKFLPAPSSFENRNNVVGSQLQKDRVAPGFGPIRKVLEEKGQVGFRAQASLSPLVDGQVEAFFRGQLPEMGRNGPHQAVAGADDGQRRGGQSPRARDDETGRKKNPNNRKKNRFSHRRGLLPTNARYSAGVLTFTGMSALSSLTSRVLTRAKRGRMLRLPLARSASISGMTEVR